MGEELEFLKLRGLNSILEEVKENVFHDKLRNNVIVFQPYDEGLDYESICNSIRDTAYNHLINILNTHKNVMVHWSQVEGTTSDYVIFYDIDVTGLPVLPVEKMSNYLFSKVKNNLMMKYTEVDREGNMTTVEV